MSFDNLSGQILGQYQLLELLGQGGMGAVYRSIQPSLNQEVAIKILPASLALEPGYLERFNREAQISANLQHPHIIPTFDYGMQRGVSYVVMRLLRGGTLGQRINQRRTEKQPLCSLGEVASMLSQLASALDYAHSQGVIHRDIKTNNVMFDNQGNAYLVDFGIAKITDEASSLTRAGTVVGTPSYMPPEQWEDKRLTPAADQYALAVLIYLLVSGRMPFEADSQPALMRKHLHDMPTPPHIIRSDVPEAVQTVLERALAKQPEDRFPNITAFAQAFQRAISGREGKATDFFTFKVQNVSSVPSVLTPSRPSTPPPIIPPLTPPHSPTMVQKSSGSDGNNNRLFWGLGVVIIVLIGIIAVLLLNPIRGGGVAIVSTPTETITVAPAPTLIQTSTATDSVVVPPPPTSTAALTLTVTPTPSPSLTATLTPSLTSTATATVTESPTATLTVTESPTSTATLTVTPSSTSTATATVTYTRTPTLTATATRTATSTPTRRPSATPTPTSTPAVSTSALPGRIVFTSDRYANPEILMLDLSNPAVPQRLTYNPAFDSHPALSPDGKLIAFNSNRDGNHKIYAMQVDGSDTRSQTENIAADTDPSWSPDGKRIVYRSVHNNKGEIYIVDLDLKTMQQVTSNTSSLDFSPAWSPDISRIAFSSSSGGHQDIYVTSTNGLFLSKLTNGNGINIDPAWSPDGKQIAYTSVANGNAEIYVMDADGSNVRRLTSNPSKDEQPTWSPDGQYIAFVSDRSGNRDIWVMKAADGSSVTNVTADSGTDDYDPDWGIEPLVSPTNTPAPSPTPRPTANVSVNPTPVFQTTVIAALPGRIVFTSDRYTNPEILCFDPANPIIPHRLTYNPATDSHPVLSPDGRLIAFNSNREGAFQIFVMNVDGNETRAQTYNTEKASNPSWSPDGSRIVYGTLRKGKPQIYVVGLDLHSSQRPSPSTNLSDFDPDWSPDGKLIAFETDRLSSRDIYVIGVNGLGLSNVVPDTSVDIDPAWLPDGKQIAFASNRAGNYEIYVMDADGSNVRRLTYSPYKDEQPTWSPDGQYIAFVSDRSGNRDIWVMKATDGGIVANLTADSRTDDYDPDWGLEPTTSVAVAPTSTPAPSVTPRPTNTPRPTATPIPFLGVLYAQDFSQGTASELTGDGWTINKPEQIYCINNSNNRYGEYPSSQVTLADFRARTNFSVEIHVRFTSNAGSFAVLSRMNSVGYSYNHGVFFNGSTDYGVYQGYYGGPNLWVDLGFSNIYVRANTWYTFRSEDDGSSIRTFLNGQLASTRKDTRSTIGSLVIQAGPKTQLNRDC